MHVETRVALVVSARQPVLLGRLPTVVRDTCLKRGFFMTFPVRTASSFQKRLAAKTTWLCFTRPNTFASTVLSHLKLQIAL